MAGATRYCINRGDIFRMKSAKIIAIFMILAIFLCSSCERKPRVSQVKQEKAKASYELAVAYMNKGDGTSALEELMKAVATNPYDANIQNALGLVYYHKEKFDQSLEHFNKALELNPKMSDAKHNLGTVYLYLGRYDEAIKLFSEALADDLYRNQAQTLNSIGWAYFKKQQYTQAEQYFQKVLEHDRLYLIAYDNLAKVYIALNRYEDAIEKLTRVLELAPLYPEAHLDLGICFLKLDRKEDARQHFRKVLEVDPYGKLGSQAQEYINLLE